MRMEEDASKFDFSEDVHLHSGQPQIATMKDDVTKFNFGKDVHAYRDPYLERMKINDIEFDCDEDDGRALLASKSEELEQEWTLLVHKVQKHMQLLASYGTKGVGGAADIALVPQTNALVQDHMAQLRSIISQYKMLAHQFPTEEGVQAGMKIVQEWKDQIHALQMSSRNANLQAKKNIDQAIVRERKELFSSQQDVYICRQQLRTQVGMASSIKGDIDGLRRTRQMMIQEVERNATTLSVLDQSNATLRKADVEYKGQRSILSVTHSKITSLMREDWIDRALLILCFSIFLCVCFYITLKRLPVVKHYVQGFLGSPMYQPPPKISLPHSYSQPPSQDSFSGGSGHQPNLDGFISKAHDDQGVPVFHLPGAPKIILHTDAQAYDPKYPEEL